MPGLVLFTRHWSFGSDDMFFPALYLIVGHLFWICVSVTILFLPSETVHKTLTLFNIAEYLAGLVILWVGCVFIEVTVVWVSMQGAVLDITPRSVMPYLIYIHFVLLVVQLGWNVIGLVWIILNISPANLFYFTVIFGLIFFNWTSVVLVFAGPSSFGCIEPKVVKERKTSIVQNSVATCAEDMRNLLSSKNKHSVQYQHAVCCAYEKTESHTLSDIANLFRIVLDDLDLIKSDIVCGLVLTQLYQQMRQKYLISESSHEVYQFLSGTPITPSTKFLSLKNRETLSDYKRLVGFVSYVKVATNYRNSAVSEHSGGLRSGTNRSDCCSCLGSTTDKHMTTPQGCPCSISALQHSSQTDRLDLVYASCLHNNDVGIDGVGFFIDINHVAQAVVVCVHASSCLHETLVETGNCNTDTVPIDGSNNEWLVNKDFLRAAVAIHEVIQSNALLNYASSKNLDRDTPEYQVVVVGYSLAAGVAALLAILLHHEYPTLHCYIYCPPACLVNFECLQNTKSFITSIVVGTDCISRLGIHQVSRFRQNIMRLLHTSSLAKWKITCSSWLQCCCKRDVKKSIVDAVMGNWSSSFCNEPCCLPLRSAADDVVELFIPGNIIHIVQTQPKKKSTVCGKRAIVYQAVWAQNEDFGEILISPSMFYDHSVSALLDALDKLSTHVCPAKPGRRLNQHTTTAKRLPPRPLPQSLSNDHAPVITPTNQSSDSGFVTGAPTSTAAAPPAVLRSHGIAIPITDSQNLTAVRERPCDPTVQALKKSFQLEIRPGGVSGGRGDEYAQGVGSLRAPLASPEALSETSSLASFGSGSVRRQSSGGGAGFMGHRRLIRNLATKMDPIHQSPLCRSVTPPPVHVEKTSLAQSESGGQCKPALSSNYVVDMNAELSDERTTSSPPPPPCVFANCQTKAEVHHNIDSPVVDERLVPVHCEQPVSSTNSQHAESNSLQTSQLLLSSTQDIPAIFSAEPTDVLSVGSSDGQQYLYDAHVGHYSPAGRGYPHGFKHSVTPSCVNCSIQSFRQPSVKLNRTSTASVYETIYSIQQNNDQLLAEGNISTVYSNKSGISEPLLSGDDSQQDGL